MTSTRRPGTNRQIVSLESGEHAPASGPFTLGETSAVPIGPSPPAPSPSAGVAFAVGGGGEDGADGPPGPPGPPGPAGAGGAMVLISKVVTSGSQASVTFSSIPAIYTSLQIFIWGRSTVTGGQFDDVLLQFNGDTGANYARQFLYGSQSSVVAGNSTSSTNAVVGNIASNSAGANYPGGANIFIPGYSSTIFNKMCLTQGGGFANITGVGNNAFVETSVWNNTAAVNAIKLFNGAAFVDSTIIVLYGIS